MKITNPYIGEIILSKKLIVSDVSKHVSNIFNKELSSLKDRDIFSSFNFCTESQKAIHNTIEVLALGDTPGPIVLKDLDKDDADEFQYMNCYIESIESGYRLILVDHTTQFYDRVELNKVYSHLKEANKNKDKFISLIAHDLRAPIANFSVVFEEVINGELVLDDELTQLLSSSSKSALALIEEVLTWAQESDYEFSFKSVSFNLNKLVEEVVSFLGPIAVKKSIKVNTNVSNDLEILSDEQAVMTVIRNLLNNSIKFTPKGGEILIDCILNDEKVVIKIQDNGVGMTKESLKKMIDSESESTQGTSGEQGSGLGMNFCQMLVKGLGGNLIIKSELNIGTSVSIELPIKK